MRRGTLLDGLVKMILKAGHSVAAIRDDVITPHFVDWNNYAPISTRTFPLIYVVLLGLTY